MMTMITIDKQNYDVPAPVADLLRDVSDERDFYRKVLRYIAYGHLQGPEMSLLAVKRMAEESVQMYPWR
jgi:hypothetical protein